MPLTPSPSTGSSSVTVGRLSTVNGSALVVSRQPSWVVARACAVISPSPWLRVHAMVSKLQDHASFAASWFALVHPVVAVPGCSSVTFTSTLPSSRRVTLPARVTVLSRVVALGGSVRVMSGVVASRQGVGVDPFPGPTQSGTRSSSARARPMGRMLPRLTSPSQRSSVGNAGAGGGASVVRSARVMRMCRMRWARGDRRGSIVRGLPPAGAQGGT